MITRVDQQAKLFSGRFEITNGQYQPGVIITDYQWWTDHEAEVHEWMTANLPRGVEHRMGMSINFESERDRTIFLLRWA